MSAFRVWAPLAKEASLVIGERVLPLTAAERGWFETQEPLPKGADYFVRLDGRDLPDPRARYLPHGVSGPARAPGDDFVWHDEHFRAPPLSAAVIYELHVGTFTRAGTLAAALERLPHLVELGVTHVELMPLNTFPGRWGWGYDGVGLYALHPSYGTPQDLKRFVARCHELGLAALVDVVYNHLGPDGNFLGEFGPYFTSRYQTPWGAAVNLDSAGSDVVRRFFVENACFWLEEYHFDGLRLDAVHALLDESAEHVLHELGAAVHALQPKLGKPLCVIAESDQNDPRLVSAPELGGFGLDAQWSDDFHHALHSALTGEQSGYYADFGQLSHIALALTQGFVYAGDYSPFRDRKHGRSFGQLSGHHLLGYIQNHDQIGNRARGERISQLASDGLCRIGAALVLTAPFVPMLFQGEEWGASTPFQYFTDHTNKELADAVRKGRREEFRAFGWDPEQVPDPQAEATYRASQLDWDELAHAPHHGLLEFYRALIALRRATPDLLDGRRDRVRVEVDEAARTIRVQRSAIQLLANLSSQRRELTRPEGQLLLSHPGPAAPGAQPNTIVLEPESVYIFSSDPASQAPT
ncbi:MAG: malto-oligosyltrehalose trehalohydrolase [Polyangiales bacterium]